MMFNIPALIAIFILAAVVLFIESQTTFKSE